MKTKIFTKARGLMMLILATMISTNVWATDVTFTGSDSGGWTTTADEQTGTKSGVTLACTSGLRSGDEIRMYKSQTTTISAPSGYNVTKIVFTCTKNGTTKEGPGCFGAGAPSGYTYESDGPTGTWTGSAASVEFYTTDNQVRATSIVVTIVADVTYTVTWNDNSGQLKSESIAKGSTTYSCPASNPSTSAPNCGDKFMGWTNTTNYIHGISPLFTDDSGSKPAINGDTDFYAVFADEVAP